MLVIRWKNVRTGGKKAPPKPPHAAKREPLREIRVRFCDEDEAWGGGVRLLVAEERKQR